MPLLDTWRDWTPAPLGQPQMLTGDFDANLNCGRIDLPSWEAFYATFSPFIPTTELHTSLVPLPFVGDLEHAEVVLLFLNPGLSETDYFAEYKVPAFRERLLSNLKQDFKGVEYPFFPLDPQFSWHSGNNFWQRKLGKVILALAEHWGVSDSIARRDVAKRIAALELVPYHSKKYGVGAQARQLHSAYLARDYAQGPLQARLASGKVLVVAMRAVSDWNLPEHHKNLILFSSGHARGAHLTVDGDDSPGMRIAKHLSRLAPIAPDR